MAIAQAKTKMLSIVTSKVSSINIIVINGLMLFKNSFFAITMRDNKE